MTIPKLLCSLIGHRWVWSGLTAICPVRFLHYDQECLRCKAHRSLQ